MAERLLYDRSGGKSPQRVTIDLVAGSGNYPFIVLLEAQPCHVPSSVRSDVSGDRYKDQTCTF